MPLAVSLFLLSLALVPIDSVKNQIEQMLSVFASSGFSRTQVLDKAAFSRTVLHEETTYVVTDKASRKFTLVKKTYFDSKLRKFFDISLLTCGADR